MSRVRMRPPQTYTRLFRPWDHTPRPSVQNMPSSTNAEDCKLFSATIKNEIEPASEQSSNALACEDRVNGSRQLLDSGHESENECASSSSSSYSKLSSSNDSLNDTLEIDVSTPDPTPPLQQNNLQQTLAFANSQFLESMENQKPYLLSQQTHTSTAAMANHIMPILSPFPHTLTPATSPSSLYYAAAAATGLPTVPTTSAAAYALNPYGFGIMEQEYARVMAEDAHLKAVNARKQRPKKFKCPHCDVAFSNNGQLKGHIRIHTGERPFKCDVESCGKTFTRNEELTRHKRIHTGLRPYPCATCGKRFGRRDHLKKHMKTHMPQERDVGPTLFLPMYPYMYHL